MRKALFTAGQTSVMEELEAVLDRRIAAGQISVVCAHGITLALHHDAAVKLEAASNDRAEQAAAEDDGDGEDWKNGQPA